MTRRALITKDDLNRMAEVAKIHDVTVKGRIDPLGNFTFDIVPASAAVARNDDDHDDMYDRLEKFAG